MFDKIPAAELITALQILLKYNPEAALSVRVEHGDVSLRGGHYTGHIMAQEDHDALGRLGWSACARTVTGKEDQGFWERYM